MKHIIQADYNMINYGVGCKDKLYEHIKKKSITWRAWAIVAWDSDMIVGLCLTFTIVKMQGPKKTFEP